MLDLVAENLLLASGKLEREATFWSHKLAGEWARTAFPTDIPERHELSLFETLRFEMPAELAAEFRRVAKGSTQALYLLELALVAALQQRFLDQDALGIGMPLLRDCAGPLCNELVPLRFDASGNPTFRAWLAQTKALVSEAIAHQNYPIHRLFYEWRILNRGDHERPGCLYELIVAHDALHIEEQILRAGQSWRFFGAASGNQLMGLQISYDRALYQSESVTALWSHFMVLARDAFRDPSCPLAALQLFEQAAQDAQLAQFNRTEAAFPSERCLHHFLLEQAAKNPSAVALRFEANGTQTWSYGQLTARANRLARLLRSHKVGPNKIVAIMLRRSPEMIAAIYATQIAGGAYLPIDPDFPQERIAFMLEDGEPLVLITSESQHVSERYPGQILRVEALEWDRDNPEDLIALEELAGPTDLAYLLYTSGSTGQPKGTQIEHRAAVNRIDWMQRAYGLEPGQVILQKTPITFDVSVWELFWWSFVGASLALLEPGGEKDPETLVHGIARYQVDTLHFVPSMLAAFLGYLESHTQALARLGSLRRVFASGEALAVSQVAAFNRLLATTNPPAPEAKNPPANRPGTVLLQGMARLHNLYGPTEATVDVSYFPCFGEENRPRIPIGKPIHNIRLYVLDRAGRVQPVGALGELHIGGVGLARGYHKRPELTAARFVAHPLEPQSKLYKTGDLARWLEDGNIEFLGRLDFQVKIRGYRIELGEIENQLLSHPAVAAACVIDRDDKSGQKYLVAYVIVRGAFEPESLRQFLGTRLASYMVPSFFVQLESIPLTASGKANRRLLPEPVRGGEGQITPAEGPFERTLAEIWSRVLEVEPIGRESHFFELGGNSLRAAIMINHIHKRLKVLPPIKMIFAHPSLAALASQLQKLEPSQSDAIRITSASNSLAAPAQKRLFVLDRLEGANIRYNMPAAFRVKGQLDPNRLRRAFDALSERHQLLRASFDFLDDGQVELRINPQLSPSFQQGTIGLVDIASTCQAFVQPFDLRHGPLCRIALYQLGEGGQLLLIDLHHIIADGASIPILVAEFKALYQGKELEPLPVQYRDYVAWLADQRRTAAFERQKHYWMERFHNPPQPLQLHTDFPRPELQSLRGASECVHLPRTLGEQLVALAASQETTLFTLLLAAYQLLLMRYTGQSDIVVGTPVAGRKHQDALGLIGMFVNTLAIRHKPNPDQRFREFLAEVRADLLDALEHQDYPFEELVDQIRLQRDLGRNPLFDTLFVYQESSLGEERIGETLLQPLRYPHKVAKFDLLLSAERTRDGIELEWEYCSELFLPSTIRAMAEHFQNLLEALVAAPDCKLHQLNLLSKRERNYVLEELNRDQASWPEEATLVTLFEHKALECAERAAVSYEGVTLSYRELNARANRLARRLIREGVCQDQIVGVMLERGLELPVALLGVLKAGGAYLPMEPEHPSERLRFMLEDSDVRVLLTTCAQLKETQACAEGLELRVIAIDAPDALDSEQTDPQRRALPSSLAYIIYTSGTTGWPKGVMIEHRNVTRLLFNSDNPFQFGADDVWTLFHSFAFDFSVWEFFGALLYGGRLVMVPKSVAKDPSSFLKLLHRERVTVLNQTPSAFQNLVVEEALGKQAVLASLRYVIFGGEALKPSSLKPFNKRYPESALINMYGITETTVHVTFRKLHPQDLERATSVIGRAIPTLRVYVCDAQLNPQPVGVPGELCVAGQGLARGYRKRPELTSQRFVMSPFQQGERLYRSGDLARWLPSGELEYLGRIDQQVKIRGHRIELGEIEQRLLSHPQVASVAVIAGPDSAGSLQLIAYLLAKPGGVDSLEVTALRAFLSASLPDYMLPNYFIQLERFPLTVNGKVDLRALPKPSEALRGSGADQPHDPLEAALSQVWSEVLGIADIGPDDNFFALGGDSIKAIQVSSRLRTRKLDLRVQDLFQNQTLALARHKLKALERELDQSAIQGVVPLSAIQNWFFDKHRAVPAHYNQALMLHHPNGFEGERVLQIWRKLCKHHDQLRACFRQREGKWESEIVPVACEVLRFEAHDLRGLSQSQAKARVEELAEQVQAGRHPVTGAALTLEAGPLLRLALFHTEDGDHLLIVAHHLFVDGVSWRILLEDFAKGLACQELEASKAAWLQPKSSAYRDWVRALQDYVESPASQKQCEYWKALAERWPAPSGKLLEASTQSAFKDVRSISVRLDKETTQMLQREAGAAYHTELNDLLLTALAYAWLDWSGESRLGVRLEGHGREELFAELDLSRTVGWFTAIFPVLLQLDQAEDLGYAIKAIKENQRQIPDKGLGFLPLCYGPNRFEPASRLQPRIGFNYLGELDAGHGAAGFRLSSFGVGQTQAAEAEQALAIDLNSAIQAGQFELHVSYDSRRFQAEEMERFAHAYKTRLEKIVAHCCSKRDVELTPSDLSAKGLALDELEDIFEALES